MSHDGQYVLIIRHMDDKKTRYITAKKLARLFPAKPFARWKASLDGGGATVVMRADSMASLEAFKESLEMLGAAVEVVDQRTMGGAKVF
ncbi:MAG: hypothetical protein K8R59_13910 [Thermoanaerobaculales bacterium]|nr:hypothetical protein [Thermoanaerobaculales bacterium]